jgi:hypothetical protein
VTRPADAPRATPPPRPARLAALDPDDPLCAARGCLLGVALGLMLFLALGAFVWALWALWEVLA